MRKSMCLCFINYWKVNKCNLKFFPSTGKSLYINRNVFHTDYISRKNFLTWSSSFLMSLQSCRRLTVSSDVRSFISLESLVHGKRTATCAPSTFNTLPAKGAHINTYYHLTLSALINPLEHLVVCDATGLAKSVQYAVVCETVETSMSFACNSSFLSVDGMTCLIPFESWRNSLSTGASYV